MTILREKCVTIYEHDMRDLLREKPSLRTLSNVIYCTLASHPPRQFLFKLPHVLHEGDQYKIFELPTELSNVIIVIINPPPPHDTDVVGGGGGG